LSLSESSFRWRSTTIDLWSMLFTVEHTDLTNGTVKEPRNGFFLYDWVSDPKGVILHNHPNVSPLSPYPNYPAIMVRTGYATLRWNTPHMIAWRRTTEVCSACNIFRLCFWILTHAAAFQSRRPAWNSLMWRSNTNQWYISRKS
jgi:hypothetical protein